MARRAVKAEELDEFAFLSEYDVSKLRLLIDAASSLLHEKVEAEKAAVIEEMRAKLAEYDVTQADLFPVARGKSTVGKRASPPVKYRGDSPDQVWSGRGREPKWLVQRMAEGKSREDFLVDKG